MAVQEGSASAVDSSASDLRVFISHAHDDSGIADELRQHLRKRGIRTLPDEIAPGENYADAIQTAIADSDYFLAIITEKYISSQWTFPELALAFKRREDVGNGAVIPVLADADADVPMVLRPYQYVSFTDPRTREIVADRLVESLQRNASQPTLEGRVSIELKAGIFEQAVDLFDSVVEGRQRQTLFRLWILGTSLILLIVAILFVVGVFIDIRNVSPFVPASLGLAAGFLASRTSKFVGSRARKRKKVNVERRENGQSVSAPSVEDEVANCD